MTDDQIAGLIVAACKRKSYPLAENFGEINIIGLEGMELDGSLNANTPNEFNDSRRLLTKVDGKWKTLGKWMGTTEPGAYWTHHRMNDAGAARLALGYHKEAWQLGVHHADKPSGHEALIQAGGPVTVYSDDNEDFSRVGDKTRTGMFGINMHWGYDLPKKDIGKAGAGCQIIRLKPDHQEFMRLVKTDVRFVADHKFKFSYILLDGREVVTDREQVAKDDGKLIAQEAIDLIVAEEVASRAVYERKYIHPEWPGGQSGVTIGIGYDIGAGVRSIDQLRGDWKGLLSDGDIIALSRAIGVTGAAARSLANNLVAVTVSWDVAMQVFEKTDIPRWYETCKKVLPNFEKLSKECKGALLSLAYNRGASFNDQTGNERYKEMRNIRTHMVTENYAAIPNEFRAMKRLWVGKGLDGLLARRDREADLFQRGLTKPRGSEYVGAGTIVVGGGTGAKVANDAGYPVWVVGGIVIATVILAVVVFEAINRVRKKAIEAVPTSTPTSTV